MSLCYISAVGGCYKYYLGFTVNLLVQILLCLQRKLEVTKQTVHFQYDVHVQVYNEAVKF